MTIYSAVSRFDVSLYYCLISGASACMLTLCLLILFTRINALVMVYSCLGVILGLVFVAVDTQMILQDRKYGISKDDYIVGALSLYLDFVNIFLHLVRVLGNTRK